MIPAWLRRQNLREANAYATQAEDNVGTLCTCSIAVPRTGLVHSETQLVPERVRGYALRLRLWAADVANNLRPTETIDADPRK